MDDFDLGALRKGASERQTSCRQQPFHRGYFYCGIALLICWSFLGVIDHSMRFYSDFSGEIPALLFNVVLFLGTACTIFGLSCEITYNLVHWGRVREAEDQLLTDLSGRSRFQRKKRKRSKRVRLQARRQVLSLPSGSAATKQEYGPSKQYSNAKDARKLEKS